MAKEINWDNVSFGDEKVSETDINQAESMGTRVPIGKFLVTCIGSEPKKVDLDNYSCIAANLKFQVDEVIEIEGKKISPEESAAVEGKFIWDDVFMEHEKEKDGVRKRRILIASRTGLVVPGGSIGKKAWSEDVIGKQVILETVENKYTDKDGNKKTGAPKVAFGGYEKVEGSETSADSYEDI